MPSISSINTNIVTLNYNDSALNIISKEIINKKSSNDLKIQTNDVEQLEFQDSIRLSNLSFSYGEKLIFDNTNLEIKKKSFYAFGGCFWYGKIYSN